MLAARRACGFSFFLLLYSPNADMSHAAGTMRQFLAKAQRTQSSQAMPRTRLHLARLLGVLALVLAAGSLRAQDFLGKLKDPTREPLLPRFTDLIGNASPSAAS